MVVVFGPGFEGHPDTVFCNELKGFDTQELKLAWVARQNEFLIKQVDPLAECEAPGKPKLWTPFPLAVMTCIGIEMLGAHKYGDARNDSNRHFRKTVEDMDEGLKDTKQTPDGQDKPLSDFVYEGFRHSLAHGFYGKWVFITHTPTEIEK